MNEKMTWSPLANSVTPSPTSSTTPAPSCPSTSGSGRAIVPVIAERSEWHTPHAARRTATSPRLGGSTLISSTLTGLLCSRQRTAFALRVIARSIAGTLGRLAHVAQQPQRHPAEQEYAGDECAPQQPFAHVAALGELADETQWLRRERRVAARGDH